MYLGFMTFHKFIFCIIYFLFYFSGITFCQIREGNNARIKKDKSKQVIEKQTEKPVVEPPIKSAILKPDKTNPTVKETITSFKEPEMIFVEGGSFIMGNNDGTSPFEKPAHNITLTSYYIGKFELTQAQWFGIMGNHPSLHENCEDCPVDNVSWNEIQDFLIKLNKKTGKKYRLPTEAEWEFAAKGGNSSKHKSFSGSNNCSEVCWSIENSDMQSHPVGLKLPNELGIYDMSGNICEWCSDFYDKEYYKNSPSENPQGPGNGTNKIRRGGSWNDNAPNNCRNSCRNISLPEIRQNYNGFRLCRTI